jgi:catechol 2,3-dioxygenase-like lactoylglutathione lyase family enzyme
MSWLQHVGITCSDIRRSEKFYVQYFGLENVREIDVPAAIIKKIFGIDSSARLIYLKGGNSIVELFDFPEAKDQKPMMGNISHIALAVGKPGELFEKLKKDGVETILIDKGSGKYTYFIKGPDGVLIELRE